MKPSYEGDAPPARLTPKERGSFNDTVSALERRLHSAMLMLTVIDSHDPAGKGSSWPQYVHDWGDKVAQAEIEQDAAPERYEPTRAEVGDFLATLALLDGLRPIYHRVLFLRAIGQQWGGWSFGAIGDRYGRSDEWARRAYESVLILAARRAGVLPSQPREHAVLVVSARTGEVVEHCFLTTATDPRAQLRDLRAKNLADLLEAYAIWTPGKPAAQQLVKAARKNLLGRPKRGSWHMLSLDAMYDLLVCEARERHIEWEVEALPVGVWTEAEEGRP